MPKPKWQPKQIKTHQTKVGQERFEQLLAEVGEVLYKRLSQQVQNKAQNVPLEPALNELGETSTNKEAV